MEFRLDCTCGAHFMVRAGLAGTRRTCECGRVITVPPLHELRRQVGLPPYEVSPELVIEHMLASGELPADRACVRCGVETDAVVHVQAECERVQVRTTGGVPWPVLLLTGLFFGVWIWLFHFIQRQDVQTYGKYKIYILPLVVCSECLGTMRNQQQIKQTLRCVPEYRRLLDKFPDAAVMMRN